MTATISYEDLSGLFANYAVRLAGFHRACRTTDEIVAQNEGREITAQQQREYDLASEAEQKALMAIIRAPVDAHSIRRKAQWLLNHLAMGCDLNDRHYIALLESLAHVHARAEAGDD